MKLLVDMNLAPSWVGVLVDAGIDAAHWSTLLLTVDTSRTRLRVLPFQSRP